ncbi:DUF6531 domain-containing protein [Streptomyces sp. NPDC057494]|uniref:DUF6531 domain-containing protein n=1 Tax=Streptomyces sp. NPDC057494 TaxID=3346148 RepID=UPI0036C1CA24
MAVTVPGWADTLLDLIGVAWPNVDEDAYRDMADALREFADDLEDDGQLANNHVQRLLSSGHGEALDALNGHWGKVKDKHIKDIASAARTVAGGVDAAATAVEVMKGAALVQLGYLASEAGIALSLIPVTGGLSALIGAGAMRATQEVVKRLIKECMEEAVSYIVSAMTEPAVAALENLAADLVVQLGATALGLQDGVNLDQAKQAGADGFKGGVQSSKDAMHLASAGGSGAGPGGGKGFSIDHAEHDHAGTQLNGVSVAIHGKTSGKLTRAKSHHGRTRGRDSIAQALDPVLDKAMDALAKSATTMGDHVGKTLPKAVKQISADHKNHDDDVRARLANERRTREDGGGKGPGAGPHDKGGPSTVKPDSMKDAKDDPRGKGTPVNTRRCATDPVDIASGEMILAQTDLALPGVLPLILRRTHLSGYRYGQFFGRSWASTLDERIELDPRGGALLAREDGSVLVYPRLPQGEDDEVWPVEGARLPLSLADAGALGEVTYAMRDPHAGLTRHYTGNPFRGSLHYWLRSIEDRRGNVVHIQRGDDGLPTSVVHEGGYRALVVTDPEAGRVTGLSLYAPEGARTLTSFGYDPFGNLDTVTNCSGRPLRFTYDDRARVTSWTNRKGAVYRYVYDAAGRVAETVGPDGALSSRFAYETDAATGDRLTRFTDSTGAVTVVRLNALGQVVAETDPLGNTVLRTWDRYDNLLSRTDPLGNEARFTWDDHDDLTHIRFPDGTEAHTSYDALHLPVAVTGADGTTWRQTFDARGNRTGLLAPDGSATRFAHDAFGALTARTGPDGATERFTTDDAGVTLTATDALGHTYAVARDAYGRPVRGTDPTGAVTTMEWTPEGWLSRLVGPDGSVESWTWDEEGNCASHTDPTGATTRFEYGHFDVLTARTGADGVRYEFRYDTELRLTEVLGPQGLTWTYVYDAAGRLVAETDFDDRTVRYAHDACGRLVARTGPLGDTTALTYDVCGRLLTKEIAGRTTRYTYDAAGRLSAVAAPDSTLTLERDLLGRVLAETVDGRTLRYERDTAGRVVRRTTPTGAVSAFSYDATGQRTELVSGGHALRFGRDARGRELSRVFGEADRPVTLASEWNAAGRLAGQTLTGPRGELRSRGYAYRADGCPEEVTDRLTGRVTLFGLDVVGRPTEVNGEDWTERYTYDALGNQTHAEWPDRALRSEGRGARSYGGTRLLTAGAVRYEYDAAGRVVLRQRTRLSRKPETWRYTWDAEDRLAACRTPDGTVWTYAYDPLGRRTAKHRMAEDGRTVVQSVWFTWDGSRLVEQTDSAQGTTLTWDYEGRRPLAQLERRLPEQGLPEQGQPEQGLPEQGRPDQGQAETDARFFAIVTDLIGTPSELVGEDGEVAWHSRTTVWGQTTWNRDAVAYTPLRFPGQYDDPETGLHYNLHRHYDPATARYTSPDPLGLGPAPNPVAYVINPQVRMDPEGLIAKGCTEDGGWYSGLQPANLKNDDGTRRTDVDMEINHIPAKDSYSHLDQAGFRKTKSGGAGMGPAIRMEYDDHRGVTSTGSSKESDQWRADQRALIDQGRWDEAMMMDINEIRELYGDKYDTHIADMIDSLQHNRKFQKMLEERGWTIDYDILK